jgi:hypothetical protein
MIVLVHFLVQQHLIGVICTSSGIKPEKGKPGKHEEKTPYVEHDLPSLLK